MMVDGTGFSDILLARTVDDWKYKGTALSERNAGPAIPSGAVLVSDKER